MLTGLKQTATGLWPVASALRPARPPSEPSVSLFHLRLRSSIAECMRLVKTRWTAPRYTVSPKASLARLLLGEDQLRGCPAVRGLQPQEIDPGGKTLSLEIEPRSADRSFALEHRPGDSP